MVTKMNYRARKRLLRTYVKISFLLGCATSIACIILGGDTLKAMGVISLTITIFAGMALWVENGW